jgi:hypothetical protein
MGAELRIESEELVRLAEELAALRKMSVADAVAEAVREHVERERERQRRVAKIKELACDLKQHMLEPTGSDHSWLYDDDGFPA